MEQPEERAIAQSVPADRPHANRQRVIYIGDCDIPAPGTVGIVYKASGHHIPDSAEYGAWIFVPDDLDPEVAGYYIGEDDWEPIDDRRIYETLGRAADQAEGLVTCHLVDLSGGESPPPPPPLLAALLGDPPDDDDDDDKPDDLPEWPPRQCEYATCRAPATRKLEIDGLSLYTEYYCDAHAARVLSRTRIAGETILTDTPYHPRGVPA